MLRATLSRTGAVLALFCFFCLAGASFTFDLVTVHGQVRNVTRNGTMIVGFNGEVNNSDAVPFRRSMASSFTNLGPSGMATGISNAASMIVGSSYDSNGLAHGFYYNGSFHSLGDLGGVHTSTAIAVSGDGLTVVGRVSTASINALPYRWTAAGGFHGLGFLPNFSYAEATAASQDGSVIAGYDGDAAHGMTVPFRWTAANGLQRLPDVKNTTQDSGAAFGITSDGSTIVGYSTELGNTAPVACMWVNGKPTLLDTVSINYQFDSTAFAVSEDRQVVVGTYHNFYGGQPRAMIWTPQTSFMFLDEFLAAHGVSVGQNTLLTAAYAVSADGKTICGAAEQYPGLTPYGFVCTIDLPPAMNGFRFSPTSTVGGTSIEGIVNLNKAAESDLTVQLTSSSPAIQIPATITIAAGKSFATFTAKTKGVASSTPISVTATLKRQTLQTIETLLPADLKSITLPATAFGGLVVQGADLLNGQAGPVGASLTLASNDTSVAGVPSNASVAAYATGGKFNISSHGVSAMKPVNISATYRGITKSGTMNVYPAPLLQVTFPSSVIGGNQIIGKVYVKGQAGPGGDLVQLSTTSADVSLKASTTTIQSGYSYAGFVCNTSGVNSDTTATVGASFGGVTRTGTFTITKAQLTSIAFSPATAKGGSQAKLLFTFDGKTGSRYQVYEFNNNDMNLPPQIPIPAQVASYALNVTLPQYGNDGNVSFQAYGKGGVIVTGTVFVESPKVVSFTPDKTTVVGGQSVNFTTVVDTLVTDSRGIAIGLTSSDLSLANPGNVVIRSGTQTVTNVPISSVSQTTNVTITLTQNSHTWPVTLTVTPH
jgi:uncharacterized membrane protein